MDGVQGEHAVKENCIILKMKDYDHPPTQSYGRAGKKMKEYNHKKIEKKWQAFWEKKKSFIASDKSKKPKFYGLIEFPYPSGDGLHVGHIRSNTAMDIIARKRRAEGFETLYPIGWDAFGLPTENYAIKTGVEPAVVTKKNTDIFRRQLKSLGFSFDWSREINTTDPAYYKWTQWIFLKFFEKGLAYKKKMAINWCPKDKIGLANEEVVDGKCERCGTPVEKREKEQWMLAITKYADRLDRDLDPKKILIGTRNPAKVKMIKSCFAGVSGIELVSLDDIPRIDDDALVEGDDFKKNARLKSEFYFKATGLPTISTDHILWIEKWPENKGFMVHMRKHANPKSPRATDEEVILFLKKFLQGVGGQSRANFHYAISYTDSAGTEVIDEVPHHYMLQEVQAKTFWPGYPTESLLKDVETGVWKSEQPDEVRYAKIAKVFKEKFAPRILHDHVAVDYLEKIKIQQKNWIGRSEGAKIIFKIKDLGLKEEIGEVEVFTTRADTLFGATYLVLAPEHPLVAKIENKITNKDEMLRYVVTSKKKSDIERTTEGKEKTGVELQGIKAINPANGEEIPIFVADYVLADYGTGAIMAVPAHDERDFAFAKKFNIPIKRVVEPKFVASPESESALKPGLEFVKRNAICAIVRNPKNDKYLCISWKKVHMHGLVTGGVEEGEDAVKAALREIHEETGYKNIRLVKNPSFALHSLFYHRIKEQNRWARFQYLFFELENEERDLLSEKEASLHEVLWKTKIELKDFFSVIEGKFILNFIENPDYIHTGEGVLNNSGSFDGLESQDAKKKITEFVGGKIVTTYKLRDWVFSRQRYWGEPIPLINCEKCGWTPVPEKDLPVKLPKVKNYKPTDTGESPLASMAKWVNVKCPKCGDKARRETDTMPNWAGSSWYYLRYTDPKNKKEFAGKKNLGYWTPVDWYNGGMEHTTLHLLYSRFWHKFLYDLGLVPTNEPYKKRTSHGLILAEGGVKMSKSKGNVINPESLIETFGADTLRLYEMFMGPFDQHIAWSTESMIGPRRFLEKIWNLFKKTEITNHKSQTTTSKLDSLLHKTIKKVGEDIEAMRFNTAVSAMMVLANEFEKAAEISRSEYETFLKLLAPFAPHIAEELWAALGHKTSISIAPWPKYDSTLAASGTKTIVVQVNGKVRASIEAEGELSEEYAKEMALNLPEIKKWTDGKQVKKVIYVKNRLVNIVV